MMSSSIKIAVISDLHCTTAKDSYTITHLHGELPPIPAERHPIESIKKRIQKENLTADYLICLGDISDKADLGGLQQGVRYLKEIQTSLQAKDLFIISGNHDVATEERDPVAYLKNMNIPSSDSDIRNSYWSEHFCVIEKDDILLLLLNTCYHIKTFNNLNDNPSFKDDDLLEKIEKKLIPYKNSKKLKVVLCHHHPIQLSDLDGKCTSNDLIDGADKLLQSIKEYGFNIILHGHKHIARIKYDDALPIFSCGSFASLENMAENKNTFHLMDILLEKNSCKGKISTWIYNYILGWRKSKDPDIIFPSYTGFGCSCRNTKEIGDKIIEHFDEWYQNPNYYEFLPFEKIVAFFPDIEYLTPREQKELSSYFEQEYKLVFAPSLGVGAEELKKIKHNN